MIRRSFPVVGVLLCLLVWGGAAHHAQPGPDTPVPSTEPAAAPTGDRAAATAAPAYQGLESAGADRAQPPRTLRAHWHVFIAFAVTWLLLFGYALSLGSRWARLERELHSRSLSE